MTAEAAKPPSRRARTTTRLRQLAHPRPSTRIRTCRKVADASLVPKRARFAASRAEEHGISPPAIGRSRESPNHNGGPWSLQSQGTSRGLRVPLPPRRTSRSSGPKPTTLRASVGSTRARRMKGDALGRTTLPVCTTLHLLGRSLLEEKTYTEAERHLRERLQGLRQSSLEGRLAGLRPGTMGRGPARSTEVC